MTLSEVLTIKFPLFSPELIFQIVQNGTYKEVDNDTEIIKFGEKIKYIPLLISGAVKIIRQDVNGDELLMFYLEGGESCAMSFVCLMMDEKSSVKAIVEDDSELILIPIQFVDKWISEYPEWRKFILNVYSTRFENFINLIDDIAFKSLDERLKNYIDKKFEIKNTDTLQITHKEIAFDLNTSREVVSRLLKGLEKLNYIELGRNMIKKVN